jgi:folate-binding protein YgfZ
VRIQHAVPLYGQEMGDAYNPLEAGLIGSIDFHKGCYIGQEVIARLDTYQKVQKRLVRLRFSPEAPVSPGAALEDNGHEVGKVTSVSSIPTTGELIGLGYVRTASLAVGANLQLAAPATGWAEIETLSQLFGPGEE